MSLDSSNAPNADQEAAAATTDFGIHENVEGVTEIESLCMNCHDDGMTRISIIRIPFFKEVLLESFSCDHCGLKNTSVKSAGQIQEKGTKFTFRIENEEDFQRQVVRTDSAVFKIETIDLETPPASGQLTNLESIISKVLVDLEADQATRKKENPSLHDALDVIIQKLIKMLNCVAFPITVSLDDPAGNSFIEPSPDDKHSKYTRTDYSRSHEQNVALGLTVDEEEADNEGDGVKEVSDGMEGVNIVDGQIYEIPAECPACSKPCTVNMKRVTIPHFKEVIIMATVCEHCGYRTNDVKTGGSIPEMGERITLRIEGLPDLSRDILKSETCALKSTELNLEVQPGTLGGRFTTVEGLLAQVREQLFGQIFDVGDDEADGLALKAGDSMGGTMKQRWEAFFAKLDEAIKGEVKFSITLEDPLASSFVGALDDGPDPEKDPQIVKEAYERTEDEIEDLGLNDMKTEGYEADEVETT